LPEAKLTCHSIKNSAHSATFKIFNILYLDDGSFIFVSRDDLTIGLNIINNTFKQLGLEMHVGTNKKKSKTEVMYFPTGAFFNHPSNLLPPSAEQSSEIIPALDTVDDDNNRLTTNTNTSSHTL